MTDQPDIHRLGLKLKFVYSMTGLFLGLACIVAGVILGLAGVAGHTSWTASLFGLSTNITDAAPGVIIFIVGIFLVLVTRFTVKQRSTLSVPHDSVADAPPKKRVESHSWAYSDPENISAPPPEKSDAPRSQR
jgi:hypothetical protein